MDCKILDFLKYIIGFIIADDMEDIRVLEFIYAAVRPPALAAGI